MLRRWLALDAETIPDEAALPLLAPLTANKTLKDPAKIDADLDAKAKAQREKMALDPWASRPVVLSLQTDSDAVPRSLICPNDAALANAIDHIVNARHADHGETRVIVGFRVRGFDLAHLGHHARRLNRPWPKLDLRRWGSFDVLDLYDQLCDDDCEHVVSRSLKSTCRVYGIDVPDSDIDGAQVAERIAAGDWTAVTQHCEADVARVVALGRRVKALAPAGGMAEAFSEWVAGGAA